MIPTRPKLELLCLGNRWQWRFVDKLSFEVLSKGIEIGKRKARDSARRFLKNNVASA